MKLIFDAFQAGNKPAITQDNSDYSHGNHVAHEK